MITKSSDGKMVILSTPYNANFVSSIRSVPGRKYNPQDHTWSVPVEYASQAEKIHDRYFPPAPKPAEGSYTISKGEGYGGRPYREGEVFRDRDKGIVKVIGDTGSRYYREDGFSFGVGDESGRVYFARVVPATAEESKTVIDEESRASNKKKALDRIKEIGNFIREKGESPRDKSYNLSGERLNDTQDIYGGGDWFVVEPDSIWYVRNNGADGDNWSSNNVETGGAGAIGYKIPYSKSLAEELTNLQKIKDNPYPNSVLPLKTPLTEITLHSMRDRPKPVSESNEATVPVTAETKMLPEVNESRLKQINSERKPISQSADASRANKTTVSPSDPRIKSWLRDPGSMDVLGVDTPPSITKPTRMPREKGVRLSPKTPRLK